MSGTKAGAQKAVQTIYNRFGKKYFAKIGSKGGRNGKTGGFYYLALNDPKRHKELASKGGKMWASRRTYTP